MTISASREQRQHVLNLIHKYVKVGYRIPSYRDATSYLNNKKLLTARGSPWDSKKLVRFIQNAGYSGLWGLSHLDRAPTLPTRKPRRKA